MTPQEIVDCYVETRDIYPQHVPTVLAILNSLKDNVENNPDNPGGFVSAVICNDLLGASMRADRTNSQYLAIYAKYVDNDLDRTNLMAFRKKHGRNW
jgi:hypothetical protein